MKFYPLLVAIIFIGLLNGCTYLTHPLERPIIEDHSHDKKVTTFSTIASRRMVILSQVPGGQATDNIIICAEPSPDVSDNIASSLAAALKASATDGTKSAEVASSVSKSLATTAQHLFKRTQGLQFYRDSLYDMCQRRMSGITLVNPDAHLTAIREDAVKLILAELPYLTNTQPANSSSSGTAPSSSANTKDGAESKTE